jgi:autotransporter-associated beta strand protein
MKNRLAIKTLIALLAAATPGAIHAAQVNLIGNDGLGTSSYNTKGNWANSAPPSAGSDYYTAGYYMRTPGDSTNNEIWIFNGSSLTLGVANGANGTMLDKFGAGAGSVRTLNINNFTNLTGATIRSGSTPGSLVHIVGNHYAIAGNSTLQADQTIWLIDSPLLGADSVILTNYGNNANDHVAFTGTNAGYTGSLYLTAAGSSAWSLEFDSTYSTPGNPSTFNPGQITFLGSGQLRDTVGCALTNANGGITLAANGTINTSATTLIGEPITDLTNGVHSVASLNSTGSGTLILSNANNNYSGGTTISAGTLQLGVANALPGNTVAGDVTVNGVLDLNANNATINGLNGSGTVDTYAGGAPTLTIGANGDSGTFSGVIQDSAGALSLTKVGAGSENLSGGFTYGGNTVVSGGTLSLNTSGALPSTPGNWTISNGATLTVNASGGTPLPANNVTAGTNGTVNLTLNPTTAGISASGSLTFQDNATNIFAFGTLTANPSAPAISVTGGISAPGSNIVINIIATGLRTGTFTLIKYGAGSLASLANFQLSPPPGVAATLVNNTANQSIDVSVTSIPNLLAWNGVNGSAWNLTTPNWTNTLAGGITVFQQYTNGSVIAGDAVTFDDTVTNDLVDPQPTNVVMAARYYAFPVVVNSTLPYSIAGAGGIAGVTSLVKSNTGSLTLLTSNSFAGGVNLAGGTLIITNDSALGASSGAVTLNGGTLQFNGGVTNSRALPMPVASSIDVATNATASLGGVISGAGANFNKTDNGTLILTGRETFTGNLFLHGGLTIFDTGGTLTNGNFWDVGQNTTDAATLTLRGASALQTTSDFNVGDLDSSTGILNVSNSAVLTVNALFIGSANAAGSTASGIVNQYGGTVTELSTAIGEFCIGGRTSVSGLGVYNMIGGTLTANAGIRVGSTGIGTLNQSGGTINALGGVNIARIAGSFGTNNLNGGTLSTYNIASSTGTNAVFNFNGGTLQANFTPPGATWFSGGILANVLAGGAIVDSSNYSVTISVPLLAGSTKGGLTKLGTGTLTLTGTNTFTGPITNAAGTLVLNSASTYAGQTVVSAGSVQLTTASVLQGGAAIANGAVLTINQAGGASANLGNLTFNGAAAAPGATLALAPTVANNPAVPLVNCSTLTLTGTNTISVPLETVGTLALIKYSGAIAGTGNCTNLALPQGATGYISNNAANSTLYAVITSTGPGIVWTGTNSAAGKANLWDINTTTNWLLGVAGTTYHQVVIPGDAVTFNDTGSGTVLLSNSVGPTSLIISNNAKTYAFSGSGTISGPVALTKLGTGAATLSLTNNNYLGGTVISNGTLQVADAAAVSPASSLIIGPSGTLELAGFNQSAAELTGSGIVDNSAGNDLLLTIGTSLGGTWNGSLQDHGHGGIALIKNGGGTWIVGGSNNLDNASPFSTTNEFDGGTTILTNNGSFIIPRLQTAIGYGTTATLIVGGGTLSVSNDILSVGYGAGANGTLTVNSGTVVHSGGPYGAFGGVNELIVGYAGATGLLTVNGGQVLNSQALWLGQGAGASGTLQLNGGLVQAIQVTGNATPTTSVINFNGGILQAATNSGDFIDASTVANIQTGGAILDDGGYVVTLPNGFQSDPTLLGGGLIKQGAGAVYLDGGNSYTGPTIVTNGLLAGSGNVAGSLVVGPAGSLGAGDAGSGIGYFSIGGNLTLNGNATLRIDKTGGNPLADQLSVGGNISYGGVLTVTNVTSDATTLAVGDTFPLFSVSGAPSGNFASIAGSPGAGLAYSFNPASGVLSVVTGTASNSTNLTASVSGGVLSITWPADHLGWILQSQTNSSSVGLSNNWVDVAGSSAGTNSNFNINPANPTVFFRLRHP